MQGKITKRAVDSLSASGSGSTEAVLWDAEVKGFGIRARAAGGKSYILHYRAGTGRGAALRKLTIGKHGSPWTPETARAEAKRLLAEVAAGRDPAIARQEDRKALMFGELIDLYLAEAQKIEDGEKRPSGSMAKGGTGVAAQCVTLVGAIYSFAIERGLCADNPAKGVKKAPVCKVERFSSEAEIARLAEALDAEAKRSGNPYPAAAIKLLLLTGCRKGEIVNLRWDHVDFERDCLRLPDSKTGAKVVYLNAPARALLQELPRMAGNSRVIPGTKAASGSAAIDNLWPNIREAAGLADVRLHDLRHSFASVGAAGGLSLPIIGALLGHKHAATTARYAHLSADPLRAANDAVGARIAAAMNRKAGDTASTEMVNLPRRKGEAGTGR